MSTFLLLLIAFSAGNAEPVVDFDTEIIPVFTIAGCNSGACHGAAAGRGGFRLSLYGGNPEFDYRSSVLELEGRRVNLARPEESLLLLKSTETIEHGGGARLDIDEAAAKILQKWIQVGAPRLQSRQLVQFQVSPKSHLASSLNTTVPLVATAQFSDGEKVDVSPWTVFTAEDPASVEIDASTSTAKLLRRGRHIIIARYLNQVVSMELIVPLSDQPVDLSDEPVQNFIDQRITELLSTLRLPVSPQADDATFLRRVTLDLTGRLPSLQKTRKYLSDQSTNKQDDLIKQLLASEEFNDYWTLQFAKLLRIRSRSKETRGALTYHTWLRNQIAQSVPYDQMARELILATGDTHAVGPANFYRTVGGARDQAEFVSELFMGNRLRCANCHNHPLDRWTQDDYHGLAAIFAKIERGRVIKISTRGEVTHPETGEFAVPRIPGEKFLEANIDGREAFSDWLTDPKNPYFAKAVVNRLWQAMMGRGLVEPVDDLRATNPATHPKLLEQLADDFVDHGYDLRHTLKQIATSATYRRSAKPILGNHTDDRFYSHALTRPLQAEVLADAIFDITEVADQYGDQPLGTRAVTLFDSNINSKTLDILGRCSRENSCESQGDTVGGLSRQLHLFTGPLINRKVADSQSRLAKLMASGRSTSGIIDEFYQRALGRRPSQKEHEYWGQQFADSIKAEEQQQILEDFVWSLLTCTEFVTNH